MEKPVVEADSGTDPNTVRQADKRPARIHYVNCDRLRIIALADIVAFHMDVTAQRLVFGIGLPVFLIISLAFSSSRSRPEPLSDFFHKRFHRIILPWLFWVAVYAVFQVLIAGEGSRFEWFNWRMLLYGTSDHLWFLPFIFVAGLIVTLLHRVTWELPWAAVVSIGFLFAMCLLAVVDYCPIQFRKPIEQYWFALPSIPLGLCVGRLLAEQTFSRRQWMWCVLMVFLGIVSIFLRHVDPTSVITRYYLALCAILVTFLWPGRPERLTKSFNLLLYGIYLVHPLIIYVFYFRIGKPGPMWLFALLIMAISGLMIWLLRRTPLRIIT